MLKGGVAIQACSSVILFSFQSFCTKRGLPGRTGAGRAWLGGLILSVGFALSGYATPTFEIGGTTFASDPSGVVSYTGTVNGFVVNLTGITKPALGTSTNPELDQLTNIITNTNNTTATLTILFSEIGFGPVTATPVAVFSAPLNGGSVTYNTYLDPTNTLFGTTVPLTSQTMSGIFGGASMNGPPVSVSSFSLTKSLSITLGPGEQYNGTESLTFSQVPEAGTTGMVLLGLALVGIKVRRRK